MDIIDYFLQISIIVLMLTMLLGAAHEYDG
jgi:hypothetical protein